MANYKQNNYSGYRDKFISQSRYIDDRFHQQRTTKKRSGAKLTRYVNASGEEKYLTTAWRKTKQGFIKIKAITTKDSKLSDKNWFGSVAVTFTNLDTGTVQFHWATMEKNTGKVVIDSMAMVLNPRAKNGGYAGTYIKK